MPVNQTFYHGILLPGFSLVFLLLTGNVIAQEQEIVSKEKTYKTIQGMPPVIAFHGTDDCMVPFWIVDLFREKTTRMKNYFGLIRLEGRPHYLAEGNKKYATYFDEEILERTDQFLVKFGFRTDKLI